MSRAKSFLLKARKTVQDLELLRARKNVHDQELLKVLQSEINYEHTSKRFQNDKMGSLGEFAVECDLPHTPDVVLRKKSSSGEEIAVSAKLGRENNEGAKYPREVLMKVSIKKPKFRSMLRFDGDVFNNDGLTNSGFNLHNAHYIIPSVPSLDSSLYKGPVFGTLDPVLKDELRKYMKSRGIEQSFTDFLILHLHKKEQAQYVNWLQQLEYVMSSRSD